MAKDIFDDIAAGLEDAIAIAEGRAERGTYRVHVPSSIDVRAIRRSVHMTQESFAAAYGFPITTLRDWEQGRARPDTSARAYLLVIAHEPKVVERVLREQECHDDDERIAL
ncbi:MULTISPECIES: helix-turn-helix domain-containing protein [unclassified Methylobacterium]|uniref:helix-turn-helix domain-containing protein n=1 Tax=unclassified Methylobacterium TaxID=2615210 RepID=UPI00226A660C|nr:MULTISPECIES: helix-turn-helix domain-containing protein [unclassified Methylobacterium]